MKSVHPPFNKAHSSDPYYKMFCKKPKEFWKFHSRSKEKKFYSKDFIKLVTKMFAYKPEDRPTLDEIMKSKYMAGDSYDDQSIEQQFSQRHNMMQEAKKKELAR